MESKLDNFVKEVNDLKIENKELTKSGNKNKLEVTRLEIDLKISNEKNEKLNKKISKFEKNSTQEVII